MTPRFCRDERGVVSIEFALAAIFMTTAMLNAADLGGYIYQSMQVENAAQMGAQAALQACPANQVPVTTACAGLSRAVSAAVASTSLGNAVTLDAGQPDEGWYCVAGTSLQRVGGVANKPATCAAAGNARVVPGAYLNVAVSYDYRPMLDGASIAALLSTPIRRGAAVRVG